MVPVKMEQHDKLGSGGLGSGLGSQVGRGCTLRRPRGLTNVMCMRNEHVRVFVANFEEDQAVRKMACGGAGGMGRGTGQAEGPCWCLRDPLMCVFW